MYLEGLLILKWAKKWVIVKKYNEYVTVTIFICTITYVILNVVLWRLAQLKTRCFSLLLNNNKFLFRKRQCYAWRLKQENPLKGKITKKNGFPFNPCWLSTQWWGMWKRINIYYFDWKSHCPNFNSPEQKYGLRSN